jgi:assimilatory nitrate reductase catalytic subunit
MYACSCRAVSVREVKKAVRAGAHDVEAIGEATGAGTCCGGCHPTLDDILERAGVQPPPVGAVAGAGTVLLPLVTAGS